MPYLWSECHALFRRELEARVVDDVLLGISEVKAVLQDLSNDSGVDCRSVVSALRTVDGWDRLVDGLALLHGVRALLHMEWYERFGGRVFVPVTGGGHTSDEVVRWLNEVFIAPTATLAAQSSRVKVRPCAHLLLGVVPPFLTTSLYATCRAVPRMRTG
jgi:hypothetical protein